MPRQVVAVLVHRPAGIVHQPSRRDGIHQNSNDRRRPCHIEAGPEGATRLELLRKPSSTVHSVALVDVAQFGGFGIAVGCDSDDLVERREPTGDRALEVGPGRDHRYQLGLLADAPGHRSVGEGDRLVVAGERPVPRQLESHGFASDRGEDGLAADLGAGRDRVDRRPRVSLLDEQVRRSLDDPPTRLTRLVLSERRVVRRDFSLTRRLFLI